MDNKIWMAAWIFLSLSIGFASVTATDAGERGNQVITQSFASKEITPGGTWKVYLNASNPDGEMTNIYAIIDQPGMGQYPLSITKLKEENRKEFSGFLYLATAGPSGSLDGINLNLTIQVQDKSGNFSDPTVFPLSIQNRSTQETPPPGVFKEQELGPIMIILRTILPNRG
jgi:hypothetical protein